VKVYTRLKHSVRIQPELQCHKKTYTRCKKNLFEKAMTRYVHSETNILSLFTFPNFLPYLYDYFFSETEKIFWGMFQLFLPM